MVLIGRMVSEVKKTGRDLDTAFGGVASAVENWDWPPGRCMNTTSSRAISHAASGPWPCSTSASVRSMPALMPAEVM